MNILEILKAAIKLVKKEKETKKDKENREQIAKLFNDRYTYRYIYEKDSGYFNDGYCRKGNAWMCPECNKIHVANDFCAFSGILYPACCDTKSGDRHSQGIKWKK